MGEPNLNLIVCVPESVVEEEFKTDYSTYEKIPCPECGKDMWIGFRQQQYSKEHEAIVVCMLCSITKYGVDPDDLCRVQKLTDKDS